MVLAITFFILLTLAPVVEWFIGTHNKNINYKNVNQLQWYLQTRGIYHIDEYMFGVKLLIQWLYLPVYIIYVILWEIADTISRM